MAGVAELSGVSQPLLDLDNAASEVERSFSGSWQGYHSRVYYGELQPPPPGAHFSQEWGLMDTVTGRLGSHGDWREYYPEVVVAHIQDLAGQPNLAIAAEAAGILGQTKVTYRNHREYT